MIKTTELCIGLTDVPIFIGALVFSVLISRSDVANRNKWKLEYAFIACAALLGSIVHCLNMSEITNKILWVFLYIFLYSLVWLFFCLMSEALHRGAPDSAWLSITVFCFAASCLIKILFNMGDIYIFVAYAIPIAAILIAECVKQRNEASSAKLVMILLGLAIGNQALKSLLGKTAVVMAHLFVFAALPVLYFMAKKPSSGK